jgi:predicted TIM-barrel fold metal-dependent hydrolase
VAHSGLWEYHQEAIITAKRVPNLYLDTAEVGPPPVVTNCVRGVGADRVLYGSDRPAISFESEICKVAKYADLEPDEIRKVLGENLAQLLDIPIRTEGRKKVELASI